MSNDMFKQNVSNRKKKNQVLPPLSKNQLNSLRQQLSLPQQGRPKQKFRQSSSQKGNSTYAPTAMSTTQGVRPPKIASGSKSCRVSHSELIQNLNGPTAGTWAIVATIPLNPGLKTSFPWLASIAQNWERYRFNSLRFRYITRTNTTTVGSVSMIPDYDAADLPPVSEAFASNLEDMVEASVWKDLVCKLNPSALHALGPTRFVRTGNLAANLDIKTYDVGSLFVAITDTLVSAQPVGKLWVDYDVTFLTPQLPSPGSDGGMLDAHTGLTVDNMFGSASKNIGGVSISNPNLSNVLEVTGLVPGFEYMYNATVAGATIDNVAGSLIEVDSSVIQTGTLKAITDLVNGASTQNTIWQSFVAISPSGTITLNPGTATAISGAFNMINAVTRGSTSLILG